MATLHATTLSPGKLELLAAWLPQQPWYEGTAPLTKAGGFRLDDPDGEVGMELMIVTDASGGSWFVPMTYRAAPTSEATLIGTAQHGVLGQRWIYDGASDPVLLEALRQVLLGRALPQHQSRSDEVDDTVLVRTSASQAQIVRALVPGVGTGPGISATWTAADGTTASGVVVCA